MAVSNHTCKLPDKRTNPMIFDAKQTTLEAINLTRKGLSHA